MTAAPIPAAGRVTGGRRGNDAGTIVKIKERFGCIASGGGEGPRINGGGVGPSINGGQLDYSYQGVIFLHLILGVLCKIVKSGDVQPEFRSLGEFAKACAEADKCLLLHISCPSHDRITDVENSILVQTKTVFFIRPFYEVLDISSDTAGRFKKIQIFCYYSSVS